METSAGCNILTTNGSPTSVWAIGINNGKLLTSIGGLLKTNKNPNPRVTADVPKGSINNASYILTNFELTESVLDAKKPSNNAKTTVISPIMKEFRIAAPGGT